MQLDIFQSYDFTNASRAAGEMRSRSASFVVVSWSTLSTLLSVKLDLESNVRMECTDGDKKSLQKTALQYWSNYWV
jgi:hypothetical protein